MALFNSFTCSAYVFFSCYLNPCDYGLCHVKVIAAQRVETYVRLL